MKLLMSVCVLVLSCAGCYALGISSGTQGSHRRLLETPSKALSDVPQLRDLNPADPMQPCFPDLTGSSSPAGGFFCMTGTSKCPKDEFYVSMVYFPCNSSYVTTLQGVDGPIRGAAKHYWVGPYITNFNWSIVVQRVSDGKIITPKGIKPDSTWYDISEAGKKVCQLFEQGSNPPSFAHFRGKASTDGLKMIRDDFESVGLHKVLKVPEGGIECQKYVDSEPEGPFLGKKYGKVVMAYMPGSCRFGIDDCSS